MDKKNKKDVKKRSDKSKSSPSSSSVSPNGDSQTSDDGIPNKWTRKAWQEFNVGTTSAINNNSSSSTSIPSTSNSNNPFKSPTINAHEKAPSRKRGVGAQKPAKSKRSRGRPKKASPEKEPNKVKQESENEENEEKISEVVNNTKEKRIKTSRHEFEEIETSYKNQKLEEQDLQQDTQKTKQTKESSRQRRPGRPKKAAVKKTITKKRIRGINFSSLEVLHAKTMASIDSNHNAERIRIDSGCVDQKLCVQLNKTAVPSIVVVDKELTNSEVDLVSPDIPGIKNGDKRFATTIEEHCLIYKYNLMKFNQYIKFPMFREQLLARLKQEQVKYFATFLFVSTLLIFVSIFRITMKN